MNDWDESVFWPEFKAAGMLKAAAFTVNGREDRITSEGDLRCDSDGETRCTSDQEDAQRAFDVDFRMPNRERFGGGVTSAEYEIEYQHADCSELAEGDQGLVAGLPYRVRESPFVPDAGNAADGYFRNALLTKIEGQYMLLEDGSFLMLESGALLELETA